MQVIPPRRVTARATTDLRAVLHSLQPLVYAVAPDSGTDIAPHVRAASSVRRWGTQLLIVSDDTNALAVSKDKEVASLLLPRGAGGRRTFGTELGNKRDKLDLEASVVLPDGRAVAFGSGSTKRREQLVILAADETVEVVDGHAFYTLLRTTPAFAGSELNVEGAVVVGNVLRLFQRGNGAVIDDVLPINASVDFDLATFVRWLDKQGPLPSVANIIQYDLGTVNGVAWTFTDAAALPDGRVVFTASAEASADAVQDGTVSGSCFGLIAADEAGDITVELTPVCDLSGTPLPVKIEGIEPESTSDSAFTVVIDMDRADEPALLGRLEVTGLRR